MRPRDQASGGLLFGSIPVLLRHQIGSIAPASVCAAGTIPTPSALHYLHSTRQPSGNWTRSIRVGDNIVTTPTPNVRSWRGFLSLPFLRDLLLVAVFIIVFWKVLNADLKVDLASFSFNDLMSLVLALFSVALSVAFYFKATETSNQFYDNTYKFTKEMSEILGRIEAGFGERLRHLDEGYSGVRDRLDKLPPYGATPSDVKNEEEEIRSKEAEQRGLIEDLARRAKLAEHEKQELFANLKAKSEELEQARSALREMQASRHATPTTASRMRYVVRYVVGKLKRTLPTEEVDKQPSSLEVRKLFSEKRSEIAEAAISDMRKLGLLDAEDNPTHEALLLLRMEWRRT